MMEQFYYYQVFGLTVRSVIPFPELIKTKPTRCPDVDIKFGEVPEQLSGCQQKGSYYEVARNQFLMGLEGIGKFWVKNGNQVTIAAVETAAPGDIRVFVLGSCLGAILHQRKTLVLHASAVVYKDKAYLITGYSGAGKSTTANALRLSGLSMLTDDVCPIKEVDGQLLAFPGYPQSKLWEDALEKLDVAYDNLPFVQQAYSKRKLVITQDFVKEPLPVAGIYLIQPNEKELLHLEPVEGINKFELIIEMTYRPFLIKDMGGQADHFRLTSQLVNRVPIKKVIRPQSNCLTELVNLIKEDIMSINKSPLKQAR